MQKPRPVIDDYLVLQAMRKDGGSFVRALAAAATCADSDNLARIKAAWPEYWARDSLLATRLVLST
jgi:hypothetical protein